MNRLELGNYYVTLKQTVREMLTEPRRPVIRPSCRSDIGM